MANTSKETWLRVLLTLLISLILLTMTAGSKMLDKKVDKEVFQQHRENDAVRYKDIKDALIRIEDKL